MKIVNVNFRVLNKTEIIENRYTAEIEIQNEKKNLRFGCDDNDDRIKGVLEREVLLNPKLIFIEFINIIRTT